MLEAMQMDQLTPEMPELLREMGVNYDPQRLAAVLSKRWPVVYSRAILIATSLGGFVAAVASDVALGNVEVNMAKRAGELRDLLSGLGPSFVKIGQALSSRPDLLPRVYLEALSVLQDRLPSFSTEVAYQMMEEELGKPVDQLFAQLSLQPVAAASLGQVYKGTLFTGETVAVKVQRPSIGDSIAVDMLLLRRLMGVVDRNVPQISQPLVPLVDEFAGRLFGELDYLMEGKNAEKFQALYGGMPRVRTPSIYWQLTSRRILTMEWIEGVKLTDKEGMAKAGLDVVDFVDVGIECTLRQLLEAGDAGGFFHADPHPGNLLATQGGDLVYLDFGMMAEAPQYARYAIMSHVVHLVNRDYDAMCQDYYVLEFMDRSVDTTPIAPALASFFDNVLDQSVTQLNFKAIVDGLGEVLFRFPFRVPAYYALILRSLTVLEGLALTADPQYKLLAKAYPYMARRLLTDPAPELRASFEDLILKDGDFRWTRLENLIREGSKSQDFDPAQLWLLADWLVSPTANGVRGSMVTEVSRIVDAMFAASFREQLQQRTGSSVVAERLVPMQPGEGEARQRGQLLLSSLSSRLPVPNSAGISFQGTGAFGAPTPDDLQSLITQLQSLSTSVVPKLQGILRQPGAVEALEAMRTSLTARFTARVVKLLLSPQLALGLVGGGGEAPMLKQAMMPLQAESGGGQGVGQGVGQQAGVDGVDERQERVTLTGPI
ncbi:MAG: hypothetical protein WDW36_001619 [Sanguina aurantia]